MISYHSKTIYPKRISIHDRHKIELELAPAELGEVIVRKSSALDVIHKTIAAIPSPQPYSQN